MGKAKLGLAHTPNSSQACPIRPRPNYFYNVHGIQADAVSHRVFVSDRENHRIQIFDENGEFLDIWPLGEYASIYHLLLTEDRNLWMSDGHGTFKMLKYDLDGKLLYSWAPSARIPACCGACTNFPRTNRAITHSRGFQRPPANVPPQTRSESCATGRETDACRVEGLVAHVLACGF